MTVVSARRRGQRCILSVRGHATGSREVCAAISGILYALAGYLRNAGCKVYQERMESGDVLLEFGCGCGAGAAFDMAMIGLKQLEREFPAFVRTEYPEK